METYLRVNLLGLGPRLMEKEFTEPRSHKGWEMQVYGKVQKKIWLNCDRIFTMSPDHLSFAAATTYQVSVGLLR